MGSDLRLELSNLCGSLSLACWVILLLPQLLEQWRLKSAEGIAIGFITAWFFGDLANLAGALWAHLRPNVILLGMWFCFSDTLLILSYVYYTNLHEKLLRGRTTGRPAQSDTLRVEQIPNTTLESSIGAASTTPLLQDAASSYSDTFGNSLGGSGAIASPIAANTSAVGSTTASLSDSRHENWLLTTGLPTVFVLVVATLSFAISDSAPPSNNVKTGLGPQILGYISALFYLCARIPQIIQNHRRRSVEGLSMAFFVLSCLGNLTYAGQILVYRNDREWVVSYIPWLIGSLGTIIEDVTILLQFHIYRALY